MGQYASRNDIILAGIEKTARDAVTIQQVYTSALDVQITVEAGIFGGFLQLILPEEIHQIPRLNLEIQPKDQTPMGEIPYTGLIVDARELMFEPVLYPVIISEQGNEIYSSKFISREFAVQFGVCTYICDMDMAMLQKRIGVHPMTFKALRKSGKEGTALVISLTDAKTLEKVRERHTFLKECRVIIVVKKPPTL